jgi:hypothetical protein
VLYKYRGLSNLQFALDIFVNQRMFAAQFERLNDPMEGSYLYERGALTKTQIEEIYGRKSNYRLLSLSETHNNMLMWSYYADSHSGMVVGVEVTDPDADVVPMDYVESFDVELHHSDVAQRILSKKLKLWQHEREHRAFVRGRPFVQVEVKKVIFGVATSKDTKELVTSVAKRFCPGIRVTTIRREMLDKGGHVPV